MIFEPNPDLAFFVLRLAVALIFFAHGPSAVKNPQKVAQSANVSAHAVMTVGLIETICATALILGVFPQGAAFILGIIMLGTIYLKTQKMNVSFTEPGGWELDFLLLAALLAIVFANPTAYTLFS